MRTRIFSCLFERGLGFAFRKPRPVFLPPSRPICVVKLGTCYISREQPNDLASRELAKSLKRFLSSFAVVDAKFIVCSIGHLFVLETRRRSPRCQTTLHSVRYVVCASPYACACFVNSNFQTIGSVGAAIRGDGSATWRSRSSARAVRPRFPGSHSPNRLCVLRRLI